MSSKSSKNLKIVVTDSTKTKKSGEASSSTKKSQQSGGDIEERDVEKVEEQKFEPPSTRQRTASQTSQTSNFSGCSNASSLRAAKRLRDEFENEEVNKLELECTRKFRESKKMLLEEYEDRIKRKEKLSSVMLVDLAEELDIIGELLTRLAIENASLRAQLRKQVCMESMSFSDIVKKQKDSAQRIPPITGAKKQIEKRHAIIIKKPDRQSNQPINKKNVVEILNPVREKLKIKTCRNTKRGDVVIEAATEQDLQKIKENQGLLEGGYTLEKPAKKLPRVIIFDVPTEYTEDDCREAILLQNEDRLLEPEKVKIKEHLKFKFKTGRKDRETSNWVYEVTPELRNLLRRLSHLYIDTRRCKVSDFAAVTRCYKCQSYGHITKYCSAQKDTCGHCAEEGHTFKVCPNKAQRAKCVPCKRAGKAHQHAPDKNCPEYRAALEKLRLQTDYG